jgi:hypothetical protein
VEEEKQDKGPIKENQLGEKFHEVTFNYPNHVDKIAQHNSKWHDDAKS